MSNARRVRAIGIGKGVCRHDFIFIARKFNLYSVKIIRFYGGCEFYGNFLIRMRTFRPHKLGRAVAVENVKSGVVIVGMARQFRPVDFQPSVRTVRIYNVSVTKRNVIDEIVTRPARSYFYTFYHSVFVCESRSRKDEYFVLVTACGSYRTCGVSVI